MGQQIESTLVLRIPGRGEWPVSTLEEASARYGLERENTLFGFREFPEGEILSAGSALARVSYNGRVWPLVDWRPGLEPLIEAQPYAGGC